MRILGTTASGYFGIAIGTLTLNGGGGGGGHANGSGAKGGNGGKTLGNLIFSGSSYHLVIGQGGDALGAGEANGLRPNGGGGLAGTLGYGGQGGGYSGIFSASGVAQSSSIMIAAGGGGGAWEGALGGDGGGTNGSAGGAGAVAGGGGATQSAVGTTTSGTIAASALLGGDSSGSGDGGGGGGGGGGYFGGGAGSGANPGSGGGGGSSYINSSIVTDGVNTSGAGALGQAGTTSGNNGSIVISYSAEFSDLSITPGLTYTLSNTNGLKTYTFTAGNGVIRTPNPANTSIWSEDSSKQFLKVALPLNDEFGIADVSATISGVGSNKTTSASASASIASDTYKYYGYSLSLNPYTSLKYVSVPQDSSMWLTNQDFTIEMWLYLNANNVGYQAFASHSGETGDQQNGWVFILESNNTMAFYASSGGGWQLAMTSSSTPAINTWHHVAVSRTSNTTRMFLNGSQVASSTSVVSILSPSSKDLRVSNYNFFPGGSRSLSGSVQDFRLYIGVGKYSSTFTPPGPIRK